MRGAPIHDLTIGSRYVAGAGSTNWSRARLALSRAGNAYARLMLGMPITDATSGFRAFRRAALTELVQGGIHADGLRVPDRAGLPRLARRLGRRRGPDPFREREHGISKMSRRIVVEALGKVTAWAWRDRVRHRAVRRPRR